MPNTVRRITIGLLTLAVLFGGLYCRLGAGVFLTLAVTMGTAGYHLGSRVLCGKCYDHIMNNRADYTRGWYQPRPWEKRLYEILQVKRWKDKMPTFYPETFSARHHTWEEIAQAMCQAELVHETIVLLSFLPVLAALWLGEFWVFFLTSFFAAAFDLVFVILQRYNRPRVVKLIGKHASQR